MEGAAVGADTGGGDRGTESSPLSAQPAGSTVEYFPGAMD